MTILQMHELCDLLIDKADSAWFNATEKDLFLNLAQIEYLDKKYKLFEVNEEIREKLLPLVRSLTRSGPSSQYILTTVPDFRYILSLRADFPDGCIPVGSKTKSIAPLQLDDEVDSQEDPFNLADDSFPYYIQENDGTNDVVNILSTSAATNMILKYLKTPVQVSIIGAGTNCELSDSSHEEIVYIAVRKMLGNIQDQFGFQVQSQETNK